MLKNYVHFHQSWVQRDMRLECRRLSKGHDIEKHSRCHWWMTRSLWGDVSAYHLMTTYEQFCQMTQSRP